MHGVLATSYFEADAKSADVKSAGLSEDEIMDMVVWLSENPESGAIMKGTGGARKVRFRGKGRGKSGGFRTIHYFGGDDVPVFLLALIDKGERDNLTGAERDALAVELAGLADDYRSGVSGHVAALDGRR